MKVEPSRTRLVLSLQSLGTLCFSHPTVRKHNKGPPLCKVERLTPCWPQSLFLSRATFCTLSLSKIMKTSVILGQFKSIPYWRIPYELNEPSNVLNTEESTTSSCWKGNLDGMTLTATKCNRFTPWWVQSQRHEQLNNWKRRKTQCSSRTKELRGLYSGSQTHLSRKVYQR